MIKFKEILFLKSLNGVGKSAIYTKHWDALKNANGIDSLKEAVALNDHKLSQDNIEEAAKKAELLFNEITDYYDINVITVFDKAYPEKLNVMGKKRPLVLYVKGDPGVLNNPSIAVVGTRNPSGWSISVEEKLIKKILEISDRTIISGLAQGCDYIAHDTTVKENKTTIAVLPSGVNVITPPAHKQLAASIIETGGCIVSEYEPDVLSFKPFFVERDAIVAALSDVTLVVECGTKSGTMYTVEASCSYQRPVACYYPDDLNKGCYDGNDFIVNYKNAVKISNTNDLKKLLLSNPNLLDKSNSQESQEQLFLDL
ncbi:DNA-protecting protein DprA [bacterium]|nr:DNA-protecting protein DprA [bacterium]